MAYGPIMSQPSGLTKPCTYWNEMEGVGLLHDSYKISWYVCVHRLYNSDKFG